MQKQSLLTFTGTMPTTHH